MLKKRIIACLIIKSGIVVQSIGFRRYLPVGRPSVAIEFLNSWGVDEIVLLDIDAPAEGRAPNYRLVAEASEYSLVPLTVGGGIRSVNDMRETLRSGADKICINQAAIKNPELIREGAAIFGSQCIIVSMDVRRNDRGEAEIFLDSGRKPSGLDPFQFALKAEQLGAGEFLLNSIDRDGSKKGYDLELVRKLTESVGIPVIICGGVGHPGHFLEGFRAGNVSAVAAANFFHFTEQSVITAKSFLKRSGTDIRLDTYADYSSHRFEEDGRISKRSDEELAELIFEYIPKEVI